MAAARSTAKKRYCRVNYTFIDVNAEAYYGEEGPEAVIISKATQFRAMFELVDDDHLFDAHGGKIGKETIKFVQKAIVEGGVYVQSSGHDFYIINRCFKISA